MNWGKCDFEELKRLDEKIKKLEEVDFDETCRKAADKLAQILLAKVVRRTPVGVKPDFDMSRFEGKELTVKVKVDSFRTVRRRAGNGFVEYKVKTQREREFLTKEGAQLETMRNIWKGYQGPRQRSSVCRTRVRPRALCLRYIRRTQPFRRPGSLSASRRLCPRRPPSAPSSR